MVRIKYVLIFMFTYSYRFIQKRKINIEHNNLNHNNIIKKVKILEL